MAANNVAINPMYIDTTADLTSSLPASRKKFIAVKMVWSGMAATNTVVVKDKHGTVKWQCKAVGTFHSDNFAKPGLFMHGLDVTITGGVLLIYL